MTDIQGIIVGVLIGWNILAIILSIAFTIEEFTNKFLVDNIIGAVGTPYILIYKIIYKTGKLSRKLFWWCHCCIYLKIKLRKTIKRLKDKYPSVTKEDFDKWYIDRRKDEEFNEMLKEFLNSAYGKKKLQGFKLGNWQHYDYLCGRLKRWW